MTDRGAVILEKVPLPGFAFEALNRQFERSATTSTVRNQRCSSPAPELSVAATANRLRNRGQTTVIRQSKPPMQVARPSPV